MLASPTLFPVHTCRGTAAAQLQAHPTPKDKDPYEVIRIPMLPDLSRAPPELQAFRDQCAAGAPLHIANPRLHSTWSTSGFCSYARHPCTSCHLMWFTTCGWCVIQHDEVHALLHMLMSCCDAHAYTGVRQAVAMITAMEHQLWWERARRQQVRRACHGWDSAWIEHIHPSN